MEDEYEGSLEGVEDCEDVSHHDRTAADVEDPEEPGESEEDDEHHGSLDPRTGQNINIIYHTIPGYIYIYINIIDSSLSTIRAHL